MATIKSAIALYDGVTSPLQSMNRAMNIILNSFQAMQNASGNAVDVGAIQQAREELARTETALDGIEKNIRDADEQQNKLNDDIRQGTSNADGLLSKVKGIVTAIGAGIGIGKVIELSDDLAGAKAQLSLIVDDGGSVEELQNKIYASAQRAKGDYLEVMQTIGKLGVTAGKSFQNNDEMIRFAELMNKNFIIAGAGQQEQSSAMYQLTQAMSSGRLQGDEYRSIIENAPLLAQSIEDYMRNVQGAQGSMKDWASEGLLTTDVIKAALFSSADEIESRFEKTPQKWGQIWTSMKNKAIKIFEPILTKINELANSDKFQRVADGIINALYGVASVASWVFDLMIDIAFWIVDNWSLIEPLVWGIVAAMAAYQLATKGVAVATAIATGAKILALPAYALLTGATMAETAAQWGLNAAIYACPIFWIIILIVALIAIIYGAVAAINHFAGTSISATGVIAGAFTTLAAHIYNNSIVPLWNSIASFVNFFANVFKNPIASVEILFHDMALTVIGYILNMGRAIEAMINSIPGVTVDITSGLENFQNQIQAIQQQAKDRSGWKEVMKKTDYWDYEDAFQTGYKWGEGVDKTISDLFNGDALDKLLGDNYGADYKYDDIYNGVNDTAKNTAKMADKLDASAEELKYLREIAERQAINKFTTAEIKFEMKNDVTITDDRDVDGFVDELTVKMEEALISSAEGVHE